MEDSPVKPVPTRLAALLVAFGEKLTGEQLAECLAKTDRMHEPSLTHQQDRVCRWILGDDELAQWFGFERAAGLERLHELKYKTEAALKTMLGLERSWYDDRGMRADLQGIAKNAEQALKSYDDRIEAFRKLLAEMGAELPQ